MELNMIVAAGKDGAIGCRGNLIWNISGDLRRFKALTTGHPVIMGRKTWESLPKRPLPGRLNIVITRDESYAATGAVVVSSPEKAIEAASAGMPGVTPFVIGGEQIYRHFLPSATCIFLTAVDAESPEADARLPWPFPAGEWSEVESSETMTSPVGVDYKYVTLIRKQ